MSVAPWILIDFISEIIFSNSSPFFFIKPIGEGHIKIFPRTFKNKIEYII